MQTKDQTGGRPGTKARTWDHFCVCSHSLDTTSKTSSLVAQCHILSVNIDYMIMNIFCASGWNDPGNQHDIEC